MEDWTVKKQKTDSIVLQLDFPPDSGLSHVVQTITCNTDKSCIDTCVELHALYSVCIPFGYHPIFRLPASSKEFKLLVGYDLGYTYPLDLHDKRRLSVDNIFRTFYELPIAGQQETGIDALVDSESLEDLFLLKNARSPLSVVYSAERFVVHLGWPEVLLPNLLVWMSDGVTIPPKTGHKFRGIGLEPSAAAFDLSTKTSLEVNPLNQRGVRTALECSPGITRLNFSINVCDA